MLPDHGVGGLSQMLVKSQPWMSVEKLAVPAVAECTRLLAYWTICSETSGTIAASAATKAAVNYHVTVTVRNAAGMTAATAFSWAVAPA